MLQGSEKLGVMQSSDRLEKEMHENMRQLTILQSFGLSYITRGIKYVYVRSVLQHNVQSVQLYPV